MRISYTYTHFPLGLWKQESLLPWNFPQMDNLQSHSAYVLQKSLGVHITGIIKVRNTAL